MKYLGPGYSIINYPEMEIEDSNFPGGSYYDITPEGQAIVDEIIKDIHAKRGEFISRCIDIDYLLGDSICTFFFENNFERKEIFRQLVLDYPFFSFMQKKKVFQSIMERNPDKYRRISGEDRNYFFKEINYIIDMRNAFAHGEIIIDVNNQVALLRYFNSKHNRKEDILLSPEFFKDLQNRIIKLVLDFFHHVRCF